MPDPAAYPRRLLLALVGLTPQVVTETLYALVVRSSPPFLPTGLHLVTTAEGVERIRLQLLDPGIGALTAFAADYAPELGGVLADPAITILEGPGGAPLPDIATAEDGMAAADHMLQLVRRLTADAETAICASIAGGRKTMGFLLGYAMSLFGRPQDRLTHVLVSREFQAHPGFFYPPPQPRILFLPPDNRPVRTDAAQIVLTDIPFVRLRQGLPQRLLEGSASFAETVAEAQDALAPPGLVLDLPRRVMLCGSREVVLPPIELAFVLWLARRRLAAPAGGGVSRRETDPAEFLDAYREVAGACHGHLDRVARALRNGIGPDWLEQRVTRVNKLLERALGYAAHQYLVVAVGQRPHTAYALPERLGAIEVRTADRGSLQ